MATMEKDETKKLTGEEEHSPNQPTQPPEKPDRRLYFPTYGGVFPLWMGNRAICEEFLRLFARGGQPVKLLVDPKKEQPIKFGGDIRGVRFDIVSEAEDFHIYCMEAQREFMPKSRTNRTLYYGCTAIAAKSLKKNEDFDKLRPVTVIFIYVDNTDSKESIDVVRMYKEKEAESTKSNIRPYNDKLTFIDINLNQKANFDIDSPIDSDIRAFLDIMSTGDDEHLVKLILQDPKLSDSTRKIIGMFSDLMKDVIQKQPIDEEQYTPELHEALKKKEFHMTTTQLIRKEAKEEERVKWQSIIADKDALIKQLLAQLEESKTEKQ